MSDAIDIPLDEASLEPLTAPSRAALERLREALRRSFADPARWRTGLAGDALAYLLRGDATQVLAEIAKKATATHGSAVVFGLPVDATSNHPAYAGFAHVPAAIRLRWAHLLEASWGGQIAAFKLHEPGGAHWLEALLRHEHRLAPGTWTGGVEYRASTFAARDLEAMLEASGQPGGALLPIFFATPIGPYTDLALIFVLELGDYRDALDRHLERVRPHLVPADPFQQRHVIHLLAESELDTLERAGAEIAALATVADTATRDAARLLVKRIGGAAVEPLRALALDADPVRRLHALRLLEELAPQVGDAALRAWTLATAAADAAPEIRALGPWWHVQAAGGAGGFDYAIPTVEVSPQGGCVDDDTLAAFLAALRREIAAFNLRRLGKELAPFNDEDAARLRAFLASPALTTWVRRQDYSWSGDFLAPALAGLEPRFTPLAVLKICAFFGCAIRHDHKPGTTLMKAFAEQYAATGHPTPLEIGLLMDRVGAPRGNLALRFGGETHEGLGRLWPADALWPYLAHHVEALAERLAQPSENELGFDPRNIYRAIERLPGIPPELVEGLFDRALSHAPVQRPLAQRALARLPGKELRIVAALADVKPGVRAAAARWLAALRDTQAVAPLEAALAGEKNELAKEALFEALEALGQPIEKYIDLAALAAQARKGLAKGTPPALAWFAWSALPAVHWADGTALPADTLRWLLVLAAKQKSAEPTTVQRRLGAMFAPADRERLGQFVLETWLHEDVHPMPASAVAQAVAPLSSLAAARAGAAIDAKGLLSIAAACAGAGAAPAVLRYAADPGAKRPAQLKALVAMLAWIPHPSAARALMAIVGSTRNTGVRGEALAQARALAERKGWTFAELADRTIPALGFDDAGDLPLDYGPRAFVARLGPDLQIVLRDAAGKAIASLPAARTDDDAAAAANAKERLSAAKKALKPLVAAETERLHAAWQARRDWIAADWRAWLLAHPVMRQLVQRLVWAEIQGDGSVARTFRPLADGTLTDLDDAEVVLPDDARVQVAHPARQSDEGRTTWERHFVDYEVAPLFAQFVQDGPAPTADTSVATEGDETPC